MFTYLHYEDSGNGELVIVFLHYFGGSLRTWKGVVDLLKDRFRCLAVDLPGFGDSPSLPTTATVENVAEKVTALLEGLSVKSCVLVGHSMGGKIAMQAAATAPSLIRQLILVAPSPPTPEPMDDDKRKELLSAFGDRKALEKLAKSLAAEPLSDEALKKIVDDNLRIQQPAWKDWIETGSQENISSTVKNIHMPVTVISGEKDPNFSTRFLQKGIGALLPQAQFAEVKDAGHLLPIEKPDVLVQMIAAAIL